MIAHESRMGPDIFDTIAFTIYANDGEIKSKTAVQKLIYFHTVKIPNLGVSDYIHYFYGPFSRDVSVALEDMTEFSYVDQNVVSSYYETYSYKLTENGYKYAKNAKQKYENEYGTIRDTLETCRRFCELKPAPLSYAAKAHYVLKNSGDRDKYSVEDVRKTAKDFDWNISNDDAAAGLELLQRLDLVS